MVNRGTLYVGILLLAFGAFFMLVEVSTLFAPLGIELGWHMGWPFIILLVSLAFWLPIFVWWEKRAQLAGLAVPATLITTNGMILAYQNLTGDWSSWAYLWSLEPMAVGLGLLMLYLLGHRTHGLMVGAAIVGGIGLFFFFVFASAFGGWLGLLGPVVLIIVGLLVLIGGARLRAGRRMPNE